MQSLHHFLTKGIKEAEKEVEEGRVQAALKVEAKMREVQEYVQRGLAEGEDISAFSKGLQERLNGLGLSYCEQFMAERREAPQKLKVRDAQGRVYRYVKEGRAPLRTVFGKGSVCCSIYHRGKKKGEHRKLLWGPERQGVLPMGGMTVNLALLVGEVSTRMPYESARELLQRFLPDVVSTRSMRGLNRLLAMHGEDALKDFKCEHEGASIAVIQVDARGLPIITDEEMHKRSKPHSKRSPEERKLGRRRKRSESKERRKKGEKAKTTRRVHVGIIYTLARLPDGTLVGPVGKKVIARMDGAEAVFKRLRADLDGMGAGIEQRIFISDGDLHYNRLRKTYFADATAVIDYYHVVERLWDAAATLYAEGTAELIAFVKQLKGKLLASQAQEVVDILKARAALMPTRGPGTKSKRERMAKAITYLNKRVDMMPYAELRACGLEIGSGAIESAVRQVVQLRFDGPGMRWGKDREMMLTLVSLRVSKAWNHLHMRIRAWALIPHPAMRMTPPPHNPTSSPKNSNNVIHAAQRFLQDSHTEDTNPPDSLDLMHDVA